MDTDTLTTIAGQLRDDPALVGLSLSISALTAFVMKLLDWWVAWRKQRSDTANADKKADTDDAAAQIEIEARVQTIYGKMLADMREAMDRMRLDMNALADRERACLEDHAALAQRVRLLERQSLNRPD